MSSHGRYLIHCFSPINVISALAAIEHLEPGRNEVADLLVYLPGLPDDAQAEIAHFAHRATRASTAIRHVISVTEQVWRRTADQAPANRAAAVASIVDLAGVRAILYAHDVVGDILDVFTDLVPGLERICYGDAMGQVFEREVHLSLLRPRALPMPTRTGLSRFIMGRSKMQPVPRSAIRPLPDRAVLMLPVDQSGGILSRVAYTVISRDDARSIFQRIAGHFDDLGAYLREELALVDPRKAYFLLTENWAEGGFVTFQREVEFYADIIRSVVPTGSTVWIKPHPGETMDRQTALTGSLEGYCRVRPTAEGYRRTPFEIWAQHLGTVGIIAMQYPALSLRYLFDLNVIQPLDHAKIETYIPEHLQASFKNALDLNMIPLARLSQWDGKSPLYSGG